MSLWMDFTDDINTVGNSAGINEMSSHVLTLF